MGRLADLIASEDITASERTELRNLVGQLEGLLATLDIVDSSGQTTFQGPTRHHREAVFHTNAFKTNSRTRGVRMFNPENSDIVGFIGMRDNAKGDLIIGVDDITADSDTSIAFSTASDDLGEIIFRCANVFELEVNQDGVQIQSFLNLGPRTELTIASGAVTVTGSYHTIDTENDDATDTLDTINGGASSGDLLLLRSADSNRDITIAEGVNIGLDAAGSFTLSNVTDRILFVKQTTTWQEISRSNNT